MLSTTDIHGEEGQEQQRGTRFSLGKSSEHREYTKRSQWEQKKKKAETRFIGQGRRQKNTGVKPPQRNLPSGKVLANPKRKGPEQKHERGREE